MTLYDIRDVIGFDFDLADDEVCGSFYGGDHERFLEKYAKQIEVVTIHNDYICCKFTMTHLLEHR